MTDQRKNGRTDEADYEDERTDRRTDEAGYGIACALLKRGMRVVGILMKEKGGGAVAGEVGRLNEDVDCGG